MTYRDFIDNNLFVFVAIAGVMFCAWVGQMWFEVEEKKAGAICGAVGVLLVGYVSVDRHWHYLDMERTRLYKIEVRERIKAREEQEKKVQKAKTQFAKDWDKIRDHYRSLVDESKVDNGWIFMLRFEAFRGAAEKVAIEHELKCPTTETTPLIYDGHELGQFNCR